MSLRETFGEWVRVCVTTQFADRAWACDMDQLLKPNAEGRYANSHIQARWEAWQSAHAAGVAEEREGILGLPGVYPLGAGLGGEWVSKARIRARGEQEGARDETV